MFFVVAQAFAIGYPIYYDTQKARSLSFYLHVAANKVIVQDMLEVGCEQALRQTVPGSRKHALLSFGSHWAAALSAVFFVLNAVVLQALICRA